MTQQAELAYEVGKSRRPSTPRSSPSAATATTGKTGPTISPRSPAPISIVSRAFWKTLNIPKRATFEAFAAELRDDLNDSISDGEIVEMLAQHLVTKPVFDALFEEYSFASHNPMSKAMQGVLDALHEHHLAKEADTLEVLRQRASACCRYRQRPGQAEDHRRAVRQVLPQRLPKMTERLGIVYTPVEVVDFILHSVNHLLQKSLTKPSAARAFTSSTPLPALAPLSPV